MPQPHNPDLSLVSTDRLISEIINRSDATVVVHWRPGDHDDGHDLKVHVGGLVDGSRFRIVQSLILLQKATGILHDRLVQEVL